MKIHRTGLEPVIHKCMCFAESVFIFIIKFYSRSEIAEAGLGPASAAYEAAKVPLLYSAIITDRGIEPQPRG